MALWLDYETASEVDLGLVGLDRYVRHPSTRITLAAFAFDWDDPVQLWEPLRGQEMPAGLSSQLDTGGLCRISPGTWEVAGVVHAWNAGFERGVTKSILGRDIPLERWRDPSVVGRYLSLPGKLAEVCKIVGLPGNLTKADGKALIKMFGEPARPATSGGLFGPQPAVYRDHTSNPVEWAQFCEYCRQDVVSMRAVAKLLSVYPEWEHLWEEWRLSEIINERGLPTYLPLVRGAAKVAEEAKRELAGRLSQMTGLENPGSRDQILPWLQERGYPFSSLNKAFVARAKEGKMSAEATEALRLRGQLSKTGDSKLDRIAEMVSDDGFLRHQYRFLGAARTGRDSGGGGEARAVQPQNLSRPTAEFSRNQDEALALLEQGDYEAIKQRFENPLEIVGSCLRSCFQAPAGHNLVVADLASIESCDAAWLADCPAMLEVHTSGRNMYLDFAVRWMGGSYAELKAAYDVGDKAAKKKREVSKPACLGAQYGMSGGERLTNAEGDVYYSGLWGYSKTLGIELTREQAHESVKVFREQFDEVVKAWYALEELAFKAVRNPGKQYECCRCVLEAIGKQMLRLTLPSGRALHYIKPRLEMRVFGKREKLTLTYEGKETGQKVWGRIATRGAKIFENLAQAVARDIFYHGMALAETAGLKVWLRSHDELGCLAAEDDTGALARLEAFMSQKPPWATGLPLAASGFTSRVYRKE